jgi:hypothetical protein
MTTPDYRALAAELLKAFDTASAVLVGEGLWDDDDTDPGYSLRSRARAALAAEPVPLVDGEVAELVAWLHGQDGGIDRRATYSRIADLLSRLAPQPVPEGPSDHELTMTYAYAVAAAVDNKRGPFKKEDAEVAQLAGLRAVLARWSQS